MPLIFCASEFHPNMMLMTILGVVTLKIYGHPGAKNLQSARQCGRFISS
jgi:hypothetical protein